MKIAIAGFGLEGKVNLDYYLGQGHDITVVDEREVTEPLPAEVEVKTGADVWSDLSGFDLVVRTASLAPDRIITDGKIWSGTNEFFSKCPAPIIGVTGTKGKGTTSSLIASVLRSAGYTVHLLGNIGLPALGELPDIKPSDIVVFELSSFQLWDLEFSPHVAVILGIEPDHLNVHSSFDDYVSAKANIRRHQQPDDVCIVHPTNSVSGRVADILPGAKRYGSSDNGAVYADEGWFCWQGERLCAIDSLQIPGAHNIENACAALSAAVEYTQDKQAIEQGLLSFTGLDHRIKLVHQVGGVRFYDDSYSSAPSAAMAAIKAFDEPKIVLIGGYDKGADFAELATCVANTDSIRRVVLYGQTRSRIAEAFADAGVSVDSYTVLDTVDFEEIVSQAARLAKSGDVVVLSPACASFDMFANFTERGEMFTKIVHQI